MNNYIIYFGNVIISSSLLYLIYELILKRETFFSLNRFYLLFALIFSSMIPLFNFTFIKEELSVYTGVLSPIMVTMQNTTSNTDSFSMMYLIKLVYITGFSLFFLRFIFQLVQLSLLIRKSKKINHNNLSYRLVNKKVNSFSFFKYIFINNNVESNDDIDKIAAHEQVHVKQYHSVDLIILEIITIIQWFNPVVWLYRKSLKDVHEFLADDGILSRGIDKVSYQNLLLYQTFGVQINDLTNNFNNTILKRRFKMMTRNKTAKLNKFKVLISLPIFIFIVAFTSISKAEYIAEVKQEDPTSKVDKMPEFKGGMEELTMFVSKILKYPAKAQTDGTEGTVYVRFFVDVDGSVQDVSVTKGVSPEIDKEALRVVNKMPKWIPGEKDGKAVKVAMTLPLNFKLKAGDK